MIVLNRKLYLRSQSYVTPEQLSYIEDRFSDRRSFFVETIELPESLGTVVSELFGPAMGDDPIPEDLVTYRHRDSLPYPSRLIRREPRGSRLCTVIAGPYGGYPCVLYTAFGGPSSPREPGDPYLDSDALPEAEAFWSEHALAM